MARTVSVYYYRWLCFTCNWSLYVDKAKKTRNFLFISNKTSFLYDCYMFVSGYIGGEKLCKLTHLENICITLDCLIEYRIKIIVRIVKTLDLLVTAYPNFANGENPLYFRQLARVYCTFANMHSWLSPIGEGPQYFLQCM